MHAYLLSHLVTVLALVVAFVMMTGISGTRRTSQSTMAWLLAILFVPFVAIPLFFLLGRRKFPSRAKGPEWDAERRSRIDPRGAQTSIARVLQSSGVAPPRAGNTFLLLPTGELAYARLLALIASAERTIDLTMFILGHDTTGHAVIAALGERAKKGVSIRIILDAVGSSRSKGYAVTELCKLGVEIRSFMPITHSPIRGRTNLRSHRKLAVFDGQHVFAGGMNLANEYMGAAPPPAGAEPRWRDVAAVSSGSVAADAEAMFESDWAFCGGSRRAPASTSTDVTEPGAGSEIVQLVPSGPDLVTDTVYDLFLTGIFQAKERVAIVTPYYVPDDLLQHALVLSARRGVRTEIVVPTFSNHGVADMARRTLLRELLTAGVQVHYYPRGMVHAKAMVIDDTFAYVGSPNFDMRSLFLNYENALCVYSPEAIGAIRGFVDGLIAECDTRGPGGREHRILEQLARFLAPEL